MVRIQADQLLKAGYEVIVPDLYGTGDSHGDFADSQWDIWANDLAAALQVSENSPCKLVSVIGIRLGALLALYAATQGLISPETVVFWNPCIKGKPFLDRFLRLRTMASMLSSPDKRETIRDVREKLLEESSIEVAGYTIARELAQKIDEMDLAQLARSAKLPITWFELTPDQPARMSVASAKLLDELSASDVKVNSFPLTGPHFWATTETTTSDELAVATCRLLAND